MEMVSHAIGRVIVKGGLHSNIAIKLHNVNKYKCLLIKQINI